MSEKEKSTDPELLRNIGIAAHIDAGKTTLTERILQASNIEKSTIDIKKEVRGHAGKKEYSASEKQACSIDAMINGGECEACQ